MKQTNNAIKFLMAQYRAIFQNAYFKGLATAAVLSAGLAVGQAQAKAALTDLAGTEAEWGASSTEEVEIGANQDWTAELTIGASGAGLKATAAATASGTGSLIINADKSKEFKVWASGDALTVDIASIAVNSGNLNIVQDDNTKHATVNANTITVGNGEGSGDAIVTLGAAAKAANAVLGDADSQITLNSDAKVVFAGKTNANAVLTGNLTSANGALLDFTTGSGSFNVKGTAEELNINISKEASISLAEKTDVLSIQSGKIDISDAGGKLSLAKGTLELGSDVVLTNTTAAKGSISVAEGATLQANTSIIKSFMKEDNDAGSGADKNGNVVLSGTWVLTGDNNDLGKIAIGDGSSSGGELNLGNKSLIKGTNVAVSEAITGTATNLKIEADTLTLGKADAKEL